MNIRNINKQNGFTLVEIIIYTALLAILIVGLVSLSLSVSASQIKGASMEEVLSNARFIDDHIDYYFKNKVDSVSVPEASNISGTLTANSTDGETINMYVSDGSLKMRIGLDEYILTNDEILVSDLSFSHYQVGTSLSNIKITCLLEFKNNISKEYIFAYDFFKTVNVKNHE